MRTEGGREGGREKERSTGGGGEYGLHNAGTGRSKRWRETQRVQKSMDNAKRVRERGVLKRLFYAFPGFLYVDSSS